MKRLLTLLCCALFWAPSFSQFEPYNYEIDWYGYWMTYNSVFYERPSPNDELLAPRLYITEGTPDTIETIVCSTLTADLTIIDDFTATITNVSFDPPSCLDKENAVFEAAYFANFESMEDNVIEYTVAISAPASGAELGPYTLQLYDPSTGNSMLWADYPLNVDQPELRALTIYPNPATERISWSNLPAALYQVSVYSAQGKLLKKETVSGNSIDVASLPSGLYFIEIASQTGLNRAKFLKQ